MKLLVPDFETYYDKKTFTLSNMTTEAYVRDSRFEALCLGVYDPEIPEECGWIPQENIQAYLDMLDSSTTAFVCHHAQFDGSIFNFHYGFIPAFWFDTLSMANLVHGASQRVSLAALAEKYTLEPKTVPYGLFDGKRWHQIDDRLRQQLGDGALHDCELTYRIFQEMLPHVPESELNIIDTAVRMFTEPVFVGNMDKLREVCRREVNQKADAMAALNVDKASLSSDTKFAALLEAEGIEVETKTTAKGNSKPALAKTDEFMMELLDHDNPRVVALCEARLGAKSTINETRSGRLLRMTERGPAMPVYLKYCAAHTTRFGGGDKVNWQNLPVRSQEGTTIREAICAPEGYRLCIVDLSQIECRVLLHLAGQLDKLEAFRQGRDLYAEQISSIYGYEITKETDKQLRDAGKVIVLQCGFGSGHIKVQKVLAGGLMGNEPLVLSEDEAKAAVNGYRHDNPFICGKGGYWDQCKQLLHFIHGGLASDFGPFTIKDKKVFSPTGAYINYSSLAYEMDMETGKPEWVFYKKGKNRIRMHGRLLTENLVQFLARCIIVDATLALKMEYGIPIKLMVHDDIVTCVPEEEAEQTVKTMIEVCKREPWYMPGLPLDAEGGHYADLSKTK